MKENIVYGLRDPRNDVYQYIGKSTIGNRRALQHLTKSHSKKVNDWVEELSKDWLYPLVDVIEKVDNVDDLADRERYWIQYYYAINSDLLNVQMKNRHINDGISKEDLDNYEFLSKKITSLGLILKKQREYRGISQEEMSKIAELSRSTLSIIERGGNATIYSVRDYFLAIKAYDIDKKVLSSDLCDK